MCSRSAARSAPIRCCAYRCSGTPSAPASPSAGTTTDASAEPSALATKPASGSSSVPSADPTLGTGTTSGSVAIRPPQPGSYRYEQSGETRAGVFTFEPDPEGTLTIEPAEGARQRQTRRYSSNQSIEQVLLYRR